MRKSQSIVIIGIVVFLLIVLWSIPTPDMEDVTDKYISYKEVKDYTTIMELHNYLNANGIYYTEEENKTYLYVDEDDYADIEFITLETECKIVPRKDQLELEKLDEVISGTSIELDNEIDLEKTTKDGKEQINLSSDGTIYTYEDGKYYITAKNLNVLARVATGIALLFIAFILYDTWFKGKKTENLNRKAE